MVLVAVEVSAVVGASDFAEAAMGGLLEVLEQSAGQGCLLVAHKAD